MSIAHRATGVVLALASLGLVCWLWSLAAGAESYAAVSAFYGAWYGRLLVLVASFCLFYHLCNGIRHLFWDMGQGFELDTVYKSGAAVIAASLLLTLVAWLVALGGG